MLLKIKKDIFANKSQAYTVPLLSYIFSDLNICIMKNKFLLFVFLISVFHVVCMAGNQFVLELANQKKYVVIVNHIKSIKFNVVDSVMEISLKDYASELMPNQVSFKQINSLYFYDTSTDISQSSIAEKPFAVYTPKTSALQVNTIKNTKVSIYTVDGKCVLSKKADNELTSINLSNIPVGIYVVVNNNHKQKFIKL